MAVVESVDGRRGRAASATSDFEIRESVEAPGAMTLVSPDIATCPACAAELADPDDRRYRYPFINCTNCGPRFTIIEDVPYDRPVDHDARLPDVPGVRGRVRATRPTAASTPSRTRARSAGRGSTSTRPDVPDDLASGRPRSRPSRGPHRDASAERARTDAILARGGAAAAATGRILAIKGLGGFHLACDATNEDAVAHAARAQAPLGQAARGDGPRPRRRARARRGRPGRGAAARPGTVRPIVLLTRAPRRAAARSRRPSPARSPRSASCCRTRRCSTSCCSRPAASRS